MIGFKLLVIIVYITSLITSIFHGENKMAFVVNSRGQALTESQVLQYYNIIGNITYDSLKQQTMRIYNMDSTTFDCWMGWIVNEGYARTNGAWEGYLTQCTATNLYVAYSDHTAQGFCSTLGGLDPSYTVAAMQSAGLLAYYDQQTYQPELRCAYLAMANPDQRCYACNGVDHYPVIIASWFDGSNMIYVFEDPNGVRHYPYVVGGGVFGGSGTISFTERTSSPAGTYNKCYMTNLYGASWSEAWNTCIHGAYPGYDGPPVAGADVLANCTGYAQGRALEIYNECMHYNPSQTQTHPFTAFNGDAMNWFPLAPSVGLAVSQLPAAGAIICWTVGTDPDSRWGHVGVVEKVVDSSTIITTESGYGGIFGRDWISQTRVLSGGNWLGNLATMGGYTFQGFILNPANPDQPIPPTPTRDKSKLWMYMKRRDLRPQYWF